MKFAPSWPLWNVGLPLAEELLDLVFGAQAHHPLAPRPP